jgi:RHS repeat-associated protein
MKIPSHLKILLMTGFYFSSLLLYSQSAVVNVDKAISGLQLYEASQAINLLPGFEYSLSQGGDFTGRIVQADGQSYTFTEPTENTTLPVNTSYPVGTIPGSPGVNATGGAQYSFPINVCPGVGGMVPGLTVGYNSHAGEGLLGLGWTLSGLSGITRAPSDLYHETDINNIQFNANDHFTLDGQRLIAVSSSEYRTEIETFSRITAYGTAGNPSYFIVETKDGRTLEYGNTTDSRIEAQGRSEGLIWNLNKITDKNGNYITITYYENNTSGENYPLSINYTGTTSLSPFNSITFDYLTRNTPIESYVSGSKITLGHLISNINIVNEGTTVRRYNFQYNTTTSRLTEIIEYGKNNSRLNPTIIIYGTADVGLSQSSSNTDTDSDERYFGDFNGDGRTDMTLLRNGLYYLFLADANGVLSLTSYRGFQQHTKAYTGDFNGDGMMDFVSFYSYGISFTLSRGSYFEYVYTQLAFTNPSYEHFIGDFNGDGISDLLTKTSNNAALIYSFDVSQQTYTLLASSFSVIWGDDTYSEIQDVLVDVNGNGKTDLMTVDGNGCRFYELQNGSIVQLFSSSYPTTYNVYLLGDINGDRKTDLFSFNIANEWKICISTGTGLIQSVNTVFSGFNPYVNYNNYYCRDVNGDGRSDIMVVGRGTSTSNPVKVYTGISNGQTFSLQTYTPSATLQVNPGYNAIYDFNGDATTDFYYCNQTSGYLFSVYRGKNQEFVSSIKNGLGQNTGFSCKPISDASVYTKGSSAVYPVMDYKGALYVVSSAWSDNINGTQSASDYTYNSGRIHLRGKGFLGFETVTGVNQLQNIKTIARYEYNPTYYNVSLKQSNTYTSDDVAVSQSVLTNSLIEYGSKRILPYVSQNVGSDYLTGVTATTVNAIDNNGNPTSMTQTYDDGSYNTAAYTNYTSNGSWMPWKPQTVTITKKHYQDAATFSLATTYTYQSGTGLTVTETIGPQTSTYQYYSNGNVSQVTQSAGGVNRVTRFEYDTKGRFVNKIYNPLNHLTERTFDNATGNMLTDKAPNLQTTTYAYDNFGKLTSITYPTTQVINFTYGWTTGTRPQNALFYKQSSGSGLPTVKEYYDAFGRMLRTEKTGYNGTIYNSQVYNTKGQVINQSYPYYSGQAYSRVYTYDNFGRLMIDAGPTGITTNTYSGKTIQVTAGGQVSSKTFDSQGNAVSVIDDGGTIGYTYKSVGKPGAITSNGASWSTMYDAYGRQTQLTDPDAGTSIYGYNGFSELTSQNDARGNTYNMTYDTLGRIHTQTGPGVSTTYAYDPANNPGLLSSVTYTGGSESYTYDTYGRVTAKAKTINDGTPVTYTTQYSYNTLSQPTYITYPSTIGVHNIYNSSGYLYEVRRAGTETLITRYNSLNAFDEPTGYTLGNNLVTTNTFDNFGILQNKTTTGNIQNLGYSFDRGTGNLISRNDNIHTLTESFTYDNANRLKSISGPGALTMNYSTSGNITSKTGPGDYTYGSRPHAVSEVTNPQGIITTDQSITYTAFNKTQSVTDGNRNLQITYDQNRQRTTSKFYQNGVLQKTVYYLDNYEKEVSGSNTRQLHYIPADDGIGAIYEINNGAGTMYYVHTDHLGSFDVITNSSGTAVESYSFDAWGRRRNPANWTYAGLPSSYLYSRGYTGHEHLDQFGLINMNGRMYDALLGRVLAPDNFVQTPDFTQSFNRYTYCLNNPLKYIDPSGEKLKWWHLGLLDFLTGGIISMGTTTMATHEIVFSFTDALGQCYINSFFDNDRANFTWDIWAGLFKTDPNLSNSDRLMQLISRSTWEAFQTQLGYYSSQVRNSFGYVDNVEYFGGVTLVNRNISDPEQGGGMTLGNYILGTNLRASTDDWTFMHEYGHTLQSRKWGPLYIQVPGSLSGIDMLFNWDDPWEDNTRFIKHDIRWYETAANSLASDYFEKYYGVEWDDLENPRSKDKARSLKLTK